MLAQKRAHLQLSTRGRKMPHALPILRVRIHEGRVLLEQGLQLVHVAAMGCLHEGHAICVVSLMLGLHIAHGAQVLCVKWHGCEGAACASNEHGVVLHVSRVVVLDWMSSMDATGCVSKRLCLPKH